MSSLYKTFESDENAEKNGLVLDLGLNSLDEPIEIRIRRAGGSNQRFAKSWEQRTKPYRRVIGVPGAMDPKIEERVMIEIYADSIVVGWTGVEDREGNPLPFTRDNVVKLFTELPNLFRHVIKESQNESLFLATIREQEAKN